MESDFFLQLVRLGVGKSGFQDSDFRAQEAVDWDAVEELAVRQGLLAVVFDGVERLKSLIGQGTQTVKRPLQVMWLRWIGQVMYGYEERYEAYCKAVSALAKVYNAHGYRMMVLKGLACGSNWPNPAHRPYGDIDIWLFGQQNEADVFFARDLGIEIDGSHHHHTVFNWQGFAVENHYDFINVYHHKSNVEFERTFKELGTDDGYSVELDSARLYLPSPNLHALFLIKHLVNHFASEKITLRQLLDWAFFLEKHTKGIDWDWLVPILEKHHMTEFFSCINGICVENLGFEPNIFKDAQLNSSMKERILNDILSPEFSEATPQKVLQRIPFKYRRWKANEWKHKLCYNESMYSAFCSGIKNHLLKPNSI